MLHALHGIIEGLFEQDTSHKLYFLLLLGQLGDNISVDMPSKQNMLLKTVIYDVIYFAHYRIYFSNWYNPFIKLIEMQTEEKLVVVPFAAEHIDQASHLLAKTFMTMNPIWKNQHFNYEELLGFMRGKCVEAVADVFRYNNFTMSWILLRDGKVVAVSTNYELTNYVKKLNKKPIGDVSIYAYLNDLSLQFWKTFDVSKYKEGEAYYGDFIGVSPQDKDKGYTLILTEAMKNESLQKNVRANISRISNKKLAGLLVKHRGAKILKEFTFTIHGASHSFWMLEINFAGDNIKNEASLQAKL